MPFHTDIWNWATNPTGAKTDPQYPWQGTNTSTTQTGGADWPGAVPPVKPTPPSMTPQFDAAAIARGLPDRVTAERARAEFNDRLQAQIGGQQPVPFVPAPTDPYKGRPEGYPSLSADEMAQIQAGYPGGPQVPHPLTEYWLNALNPAGAASWAPDIPGVTDMPPTPQDQAPASAQAGGQDLGFLQNLYRGNKEPPNWWPGVGAIRAGEAFFDPEEGALAKFYDQFDPGVRAGGERSRTVGDLPLTDRYSLPDQAGFQGGRGGAGSGGVGPATNTGVTPLPTNMNDPTTGVWPMPTIVGGGGPGVVDGSGMGKTTPSFEDLLATARGEAVSGGRREALLRGLNPIDYESLFEEEARRIGGTIPVPPPVVGGVPNAPTNFASFYTPDFGSRTLDLEQERQRNVFGQQVGAFTSPGYERGFFPSTFDDATIESILARRRAPAQQVLTNASARGRLNAQGLEAAQLNLRNQAGVARSTLSELGGGILEQNRNLLAGIGREAATGAREFTLGGSFDPGSFRDRISSAASEAGGRFESDLLRAAGPQGTFFDPRAALSAGGTGQGPQNIGISDALAQRRRRRDTSRGLGSTGAF
jgi:hypothetical protein